MWEKIWMSIRRIDFQEKQNGDKLDYMAGIVDSEGTIGFSGSIRIQIGNTDKRLINWIKKEFGGNITPTKTGKKEHAQAWKWTVQGKDAYKVLKKIKDKLLLKNEQCLLCIEMYERINKPDFRGREKPQWAKRLTEEIADKLHVLNKTGIDKTGVLRTESEIKIENKLAYLGGYVDGDGTIGIQKHGDTEPPRYQHHLSVASTDPRSPEWIKQNFGGEITTYEARAENRAKGYQWQIYGKKSYMLIKDVRYYLMLKHEQADAVIEMYERVTKRDFRPRPIWASKLQERMFQKCKKLNMTGVIEEGEEMEIEEEEEEKQRGLNNWL